MAVLEPAYSISRFRTQQVLSNGKAGGYKVFPRTLSQLPPRAAALNRRHRSPCQPNHPLLAVAQGKAEHAGALGALQLVRPSAIGVVAHLALGTRSLGGLGLPRLLRITNALWLYHSLAVSNYS